MATPVPGATMINVTRKVLSMATMNVSSVAVGCCAATANSPKIALAANAPGIIGMQPMTGLNDEQAKTIAEWVKTLK
jgi:hypothetical protein